MIVLVDCTPMRPDFGWFDKGDDVAIVGASMRDTGGRAVDRLVRWALLGRMMHRFNERGWFYNQVHEFAGGDHAAILVQKTYADEIGKSRKMPFARDLWEQIIRRKVSKNWELWTNSEMSANNHSLKEWAVAHDRESFGLAAAALECSHSDTGGSAGQMIHDLWQELIGQPVIPYAAAKRRTQLAHAFSVLAPYISKHQERRTATKEHRTSRWNKPRRLLWKEI